MQRWLVTTLDGYDLDVRTFFLNAESLDEVADYICDKVGDYEKDKLLINDKINTVYGEIEFDEHHMTTCPWVFAQPVESVEEFNAE